MKKQKRLEAIKNNPSGVRFDDFSSAIVAAGFTFSRQKGSHRVYTNERSQQTLIIQPGTNGMAKPYQVKQFLAMLE